MDYRGEWVAVFTSITGYLHTKFPYEVGDRVAQIYFDNVLPIVFNSVTSLEESTRGTGGFGSTGIK